MACWMVTRWLSPLLLDDIMFSLVVDDRLRRVVVERHIDVKAAAVVLLRNMRVDRRKHHLVVVGELASDFSSRGEKIFLCEDFAT